LGLWIVSVKGSQPVDADHDDDPIVLGGPNPAAGT